GIVKLHGRDANVEDDAIGRRETGGRGQAVEVAEPALAQLQATGIMLGQPTPRGERGRIAIDGEGPRVRPRRPDGLAVAASPERGVNEGPTIARCDGMQHLGKEHGNMTLGPSRGTLGRAGAAVRHHSRAPPSPPLSPSAGRLPAPNSWRCRCTFSRARTRRSAKRSGSHIWNLVPRPTNATWVQRPAWARSASGSTIRPS